MDSRPRGLRPPLGLNDTWVGNPGFFLHVIGRLPDLVGRCAGESRSFWLTETGLHAAFARKTALLEFGDARHVVRKALLPGRSLEGARAFTAIRSWYMFGSPALPTIVELGCCSEKQPPRLVI